MIQVNYVNDNGISNEDKETAQSDFTKRLGPFKEEFEKNMEF